MRLCSLFAGIGGFDLAAHWMAWATAVMVEWDDFGRKVLIKNFKCVPAESLSAAQLAEIISQWKVWCPGQPQPTTVLYGDICQFNACAWRGAIDLVCGGFPCQPFSSAGAGGGVNDPRHLWPQMLRIIREVRPSYVVGENVRGLLTKHPLQFEAVCADLEAEGYDVQPFLLPAAGVGAPHERYRFWFVAHANHGQRQRPERKICAGRHAAGLCGEANADSSGTGWQEPHAPDFAAKSGLGAGHGNAGNAAHAASQRQQAGCSGGVCKRSGQGGAAQRDEQRAGLRCPANGCGPVPAYAAGQCAGCKKQCGQNLWPQSDRPTSGLSGCADKVAADTRSDQPRPVSNLLGRESDASGRIAGDATGIQSHGVTSHSRHRRQQQGKARRASGSSGRAFRLTEPALRCADDGLSSRLVRAALKAYGNAVVPQVVHRFYQAIAATL